MKRFSIIFEQTKQLIKFDSPSSTSNHRRFGGEAARLSGGETGAGNRRIFSNRAHRRQEIYGEHLIIRAFRP